MLQLQSITLEHANDLTKILNHDPSLYEMLNGKVITPEEFLDYNKEWSIKHNAQLYAIVKNDNTIGSISLSHIDLEKQTASSGYWLTSAETGKGYATLAFKLVIDEAKKLNLISLTSKIKKDNFNSIRIWQKYSPIYQDLDDKWQLTIVI